MIDAQLQGERDGQPYLQLVKRPAHDVLGDNVEAASHRDIGHGRDARRFHGNIHRRITEAKHQHTLANILVRDLVIVAVGNAAIEAAGERRLGPARVPVMPVGHEQGAIAMHRAIMQRDLPATTFKRPGLRH